MSEIEGKLLRDTFDPTEILKKLREEAFYVFGPAGMRLVGPELELFLDHNVREALNRAFSECEGQYIAERFRQSEESSSNMVRAVLAGAELGLRSRDDREGE